MIMVNADDFGLSENVSNAIVSYFKEMKENMRIKESHLKSWSTPEQIAKETLLTSRTQHCLSQF
jgi:nicotinamide mononucleotide (NMN) deamidase PncC